MVVVFVLGLIVSSLLERRAEVVSIYNNRKHLFKDSIVSQNEMFAEDFPREYQTWTKGQPTLPTRVSSIAHSVSMCSQLVLRWSYYGPAIPSLWSTTLHGGTSMPSKICKKS